MNNELFSLYNRIITNEKIPREIYLELAYDEGNRIELMYCAYKVKKYFKKDTVNLCSVFNAKSGSCNQDCAFCSQSAHHTSQITHYPLKNTSELELYATQAAENLVHNFGIVTSGKALLDSEMDALTHAIENMSHQATDMTIDASLGTLSLEQLSLLKKAGLKRYHHNLETSERFFNTICTTHTYNDRINTIKRAKKAGLEVCSGGIFGIGETWEDRIDLAFLLKELDVEGVPINFLIPVKGTKLEHKELLPPLESLAIISLFRLILPDKDIRVCGGRTVVLRDFQSWLFFAGANGMMVGDYLTTKGRQVADDLKMLRDLGLSHNTVLDEQAYARN
ncbi:biotin synthase BioB [Chlamydiota bacterium]